jgi:hypothetical protein
MEPEYFHFPAREQYIGSGETGMNVVSSHRNHENAQKKIAKIPTPFGGRSGASSGPRWAIQLI